MNRSINVTGFPDPHLPVYPFFCDMFLQAKRVNGSTGQPFYTAPPCQLHSRMRINELILLPIYLNLALQIKWDADFIRFKQIIFILNLKILNLRVHIPVLLHMAVRSVSKKEDTFIICIHLCNSVSQ